MKKYEKHMKKYKYKKIIKNLGATKKTMSSEFQGLPKFWIGTSARIVGLGNSGSLIFYFKIFENFVKHFFGRFKLDRIRMTKLA